MIFKGIYNLRLVSSESIVTGLYEDKEEENSYYLANPMEITFYNRPGGSHMISLSPWMPFGDKNERHQIYPDTIIAMSKCGSEMIEYYNSIVTKYTGGFVNEPAPREPEEEPLTIEEVEESLDILEAMTEKAKGRLH